MSAWTATKFISGLVGHDERPVPAGGRCAVCSRRYRDLDRHWTTAHEWLIATRPAAQRVTQCS